MNPTTKHLETERVNLNLQREKASPDPTHYAFLLGALSVIDWLNAESPSPSSILARYLSK